MPAVTFAVSDQPVAEAASSAVDPVKSVIGILKRRVEAMDLSDRRLVTCNDAHPFAQAAHDAFYDHYPLTISPDDIWFCIAQGFSHYVNQNAKQLRRRFVSHAGKKKLSVERRDFTLGKDNPWPEVFTSFSQQISDNVGRELRDLVVADFSTTTAFHRAATEVALMDTFQAYFEYELMCGCGIPSITLTGAPDDWRDVRRRAKALAAYGCEEWIDVLLPVLDQIEASSRGFNDRAFWQSFFRYRSASLGTAMTGWIQVLFPYLKDLGGKPGAIKPNPFLYNWREQLHRAVANEAEPDWRKRERFSGPTLGEIPSGLASAPVQVIDLRTDEKHDMRFIAGMFGVAQDATTKNLSASFGWAVVYEQPQPTQTTRPTSEHRQARS